MKIGIHTTAFQLYRMKDALKTISELGYEYVELAADISGTPHFAAHTADTDQIADLHQLLDTFHLGLIAIDIGGWDAPLCIANLDESQRKIAVHNVKHAINVARELNCSLITSHLWGLSQTCEESSVMSHCKAFKTSIRELSPQLGAANVKMNFMPHPGGFIEESDPAVDLIRETDCPHIGYTYGIGHTFVISRPGQTAKNMITYAGKTLTHVLFSDTHKVERIIAPPEVKAHLHLVPGRGDIDFGAILGALRGIGYDGTLSVHIISETDRIVQAARETKQRLELLLDTP